MLSPHSCHACLSQRLLRSWFNYTLLSALACLLITGCTKESDKSLPNNAGNPNSVASTKSEPPINLAFQDVTTASGVRSVYRNGEESDALSIVESIGGGMGVLDYDLSGTLDLIFPTGGNIAKDQPLSGLPATLWRSDSDMRFTESSAAAQVDSSNLYTHGVAIADIDNDGFPDVLVTGYRGLQLFYNMGDGTFQECSRAKGVESNLWSTSAAFGDFDNDGLVDIFIATYVDWSWQKNPSCLGNSPNGKDVCTPQVFTGENDLVFWNQGDGTFTRSDSSNGLVAEGKGLGVIAADFDQDSKLDIYVANDTTNNFLYMNQGERKLRESGVIAGCALDHLGVPNGSMGVTLFDYDSDHKPDIFVTNYERETFAVYRNEGLGNFRCISERTGVTAFGLLYVGFGTVSGDFACKGREDLIVSNGHVMRYPGSGKRDQEPMYIESTKQGKLILHDFGPDNYFSKGHTGRGVVASDLNSDGLLDLVFSHVNQPATVLRNDSKTKGNWLKIQLIGTEVNRDAIGAQVIVKTNRGQHLRSVIGGGSYLSQGDYVLHWGMGEGELPLEASISWGDGTTQTIASLNPNTLLTIVQPLRN
jgi:hypothetical protein